MKYGAFALFAIIIISMFATFQNSVTAESIPEVYELTYQNNVYTIPYTITNGTLKSIIKDEEFDGISIRIDSKEDGILEISLPRELVDPIDLHGKMVVIQNGEEVKYNDLEIACDYRKFNLTFLAGTHGIEIVPAGDPRTPWDTLYDKIQVKAEGRQFDIETHSEGAICNLEFIQQEKKISIIIRGVKGTESTVDVIIPHELLSGEFKVMLDGSSTQFTINRTEKDSTITVALDFPQSERQVDIIGTQVIPEFQVLALIIFATAISYIIFARLIPKRYHRRATYSNYRIMRSW